MHCAPGGVEESDVGLLLKRRYEITGQCEFGLGLTACRSARPETLEMEGSVCYRSVFGSNVPWLQLQNSWRGFGKAALLPRQSFLPSSDKGSQTKHVPKHPRWREDGGRRSQ